MACRRRGSALICGLFMPHNTVIQLPNRLRAAMNLSDNPDSPALLMRDVSRGFRVGQRSIDVLDQLSLTVNRGERVAIMGASGSGKSTLLNLAAGMDRPDRGRVEVLGTNLAGLGEPALTRFRARHVSLVFQNFNLIDSLSVRENIALPLWLNKLGRSGNSILPLADTLGIADLLGRLPGELSGGERQRVAIARALIHQPALLLADEPTGSLDESTAERILELFSAVTAERGCTMIMVTHNPRAAVICDRRLRLAGGRLHEDS